jgi:hypothetical protein
VILALCACFPSSQFILFPIRALVDCNGFSSLRIIVFPSRALVHCHSSFVYPTIVCLARDITHRPHGSQAALRPSSIESSPSPAACGSILSPVLPPTAWTTQESTPKTRAAAAGRMHMGVCAGWPCTCRQTVQEDVIAHALGCNRHSGLVRSRHENTADVLRGFISCLARVLKPLGEASGLQAAPRAASRHAKI